jgi:MFS family permease
MVAVALPAIRRDFDVGVVAVTGLVSGYLVAVAIAQPIGGRLGDGLGSLRVLRAGLVIMALFSVLSALSPNFPLLLATRSVQGVAAALLIPNATAYLRRSVDVQRLGSVLGTNGAFTACGAAAGPVLGGLLLAAGDWRILFLANLPIAALSLVLVAAVPADTGAGWRSTRLQLPSILSLAAAFTGLALAGAAVRSGLAVFVAGAGVLSVAGAAAYLVLYRLRGGGVVDLQLFSSPVYSIAAVMTSLSNLVMYTTLIALPVYLREFRDMGAAGIGALLFAMSALMGVLSWYGGNLGDRFGIRAVLIAGNTVLVCASVGVVASVAIESTPLLGVSLALIGAGMGVAMPAQQSAALAAWPASAAGSAAGTLSLMRYVGSVTGASLLALTLGADPSVGAFELLLALVAAIAVVNLLVAFVPAHRPAGAHAGPGTRSQDVRA